MLRSCLRADKVVKYKGNDVFGTISKVLEKNWGTGDEMKNRDHSDQCTVEISYNT